MIGKERFLSVSRSGGRSTVLKEAVSEGTYSRMMLMGICVCR